jgi:hypothetical protein
MSPADLQFSPSWTFLSFEKDVQLYMFFQLLDQPAQLFQVEILLSMMKDQAPFVVETTLLNNLANEGNQTITGAGNLLLFQRKNSFVGFTICSFTQQLNQTNNGSSCFDNKLRSGLLLDPFTNNYGFCNQPIDNLL